MSTLTDCQKIVLRGLSAVSWKRPAEIRGYKRDQRLYAALQQLVTMGMVESRPRNVGTGDSKEYRIRVPDGVCSLIPEVIIPEINEAAEIPLRRCTRCGERVRAEGETILCDGPATSKEPASVIHRVLTQNEIIARLKQRPPQIDPDFMFDYEKQYFRENSIPIISSADDAQAGQKEKA